MLFIWGAVVLVAVVWLATCIVIVNGKTAAILETFGRPHDKARTPGLRFKAPWPITIVVDRVNLQLQEVGENVSVKTSDNAFMTLPVKVQYRASDEPSGSVKAHYELENPEQQITSYILNNVRQTAAGMEMIELYRNRDAMEEQVQEALSERFVRFGYIIENVLVDEPQPSEEVKSAFNRVIASKREKEAAENLAAAKRIELVGIAEAEAESKRLQGEGMAKMRKAITEGLEESVELMRKCGLTIEQAITLLTDTNRLDTISTAATNGNLVIVDMARANDDFINTLAAVKTGELSKEHKHDYRL
jgi:regulator of protease activity HflC (stomatin/prohibitin superfamily)